MKTIQKYFDSQTRILPNFPKQLSFPNVTTVHLKLFLRISIGLYVKLHIVLFFLFSYLECTLYTSIVQGCLKKNVFKQFQT